MIEPTHPQLPELVYLTDVLKGKVQKNLNNPSAWNHFYLERLYRLMPGFSQGKRDETEFATIITIAIILSYMQAAFFMREPIKKGVDGWFLITHFLEQSIYSLRHHAPQQMNRDTLFIMELFRDIPEITIPKELKACIISMSQNPYAKNNIQADEDYMKQIPLYEDYLTHFYPPLVGTPNLFVRPPQSISYIIQSFYLLLPNHLETPFGEKREKHCPHSVYVSLRQPRFFYEKMVPGPTRGKIPKKNGYLLECN